MYFISISYSDNRYHVLFFILMETLTKDKLNEANRARKLTNASLIKNHQQC
ncbi:hypothetical protein Sez_1218 [Streptococcus equi subsp. zooepidemicus MGCS10565]|uniref:Uncharacterized protein n=1 Tax=Streptococcus equi subsp. zooepidemicus (strain MGCS10565) TaxID=552526 RepID=B4U3J1_STREM|nr:hypothetical protein Sez_1218 [Streptococcus equi subsp. zooepidemicus MGCS10565]